MRGHDSPPHHERELCPHRLHERDQEPDEHTGDQQVDEGETPESQQQIAHTEQRRIADGGRDRVVAPILQSIPRGVVVPW
jgi:hypothetical protein